MWESVGSKAFRYLKLNIFYYVENYTFAEKI